MCLTVDAERAQERGFGAYRPLIAGMFPELRGRYGDMTGNDKSPFVAILPGWELKSPGDGHGPARTDYDTSPLNSTFSGYPYVAGLLAKTGDSATRIPGASPTPSTTGWRVASRISQGAFGHLTSLAGSGHGSGVTPPHTSQQ
ncbi:hypothetical protein GCM10009540_21010 [Streptomyces turgidiscabies]